MGQAQEHRVFLKLKGLSLIFDRLSVHFYVGLGNAVSSSQPLPSFLLFFSPRGRSFFSLSSPPPRRHGVGSSLDVPWIVVAAMFLLATLAA